MGIIKTLVMVYLVVIMEELNYKFKVELMI